MTQVLALGIDDKVNDGHDVITVDTDDESTKIDPALPEDLPCLRFSHDNSDADGSFLKTVSITTEGDGNDADLTDHTEELHQKSVTFETDSSESEISVESEEEDVELFLTMLALNSNDEVDCDGNDAKSELAQAESESQINPGAQKRLSAIILEKLDGENVHISRAAIRNSLLEHSVNPYLKRHSLMALRSSVAERSKSAGDSSGSSGRLSRKLVASVYEPSRASITKVKELQEKNRRRKSDMTAEKGLLRHVRLQSLIGMDDTESDESEPPVIPSGSTKMPRSRSIN